MNWRTYLMVTMLGILIGMPTLAQKKSEERPVKTTVAAILRNLTDSIRSWCRWRAK
jgi:hypothetical protein